MPHVTDTFVFVMWSCGCSFTTFFLFLGTCSWTWVPGYLGTWVPGYLGTWVPGHLGTWVCLSDPRVRQSDSGVRL